MFHGMKLNKAPGEHSYNRRILLMSGIAMSAMLSSPALAQSTGTQAENADSGEIIVTAQRREENILRVPLSVTSYSQEQMDQQGIHSIDDISRLTPSLRFVRTTGQTGNNGANISIRGIASDVGAATTAIYIDDTPIQIRSVGYFPGNPYPRVFDLERVEVLRGPQGTLFGAGAEGGAVRFITPQPDFDRYSVYARSELATTQNGDESYELGVAVGGPITDTLAFRVSGWYRRDGGYIDVIDPSTLAVTQPDVNDESTTALKGSLAWRPVDGLTVTAGLYYQRVESGGRNQFWEGYGDTDSQDYVTGRTNSDASSDRFWLPSLKIEYALNDTLTLYSNTSYFDREQHQVLDYANYLSFLRSGSPFGTYGNKDASNAFADLTNQQKNFVQEIRLQSVDPDSLIDWTIGAYYSRTQQHLIYYSASGRIPGVISSGYPQYLNRYNLFELIDANDRQFAGFASIDIKPVPDVKITLGGRYTHNEFDFMDFRTGPVNSGTSTTVNFNQSENSFTPKVGVTWQVDDRNMVYASASKGFRTGGAQPIVDPNFCAADIASLGVTTSPTQYDSDSLWAFEVGSKNRLFGNLLTVDANAYLIRWNDIQQAVRLPTCGFTFIGNLGAATSKGTDISITVHPAPGIQFGGSIGYNHTTYDDNVYFDGDTQDANPGVLVRLKGQRIGGPAWTGSAFVSAEMPLTNEVDGYARMDYSFNSHGFATPSGVYGYDAGLYALDGTDYMSIRVGARFGGLDASLFVNNLTNENQPYARNHDGIGSPLYYDETYRPRTYGLTLQYRY